MVLPGQEHSMGWQLTVADLKQYSYCPRVVYYRYVQPIPEQPTNKMRFGHRAHQRAKELQERRTLGTFDVSHGEGHRHFRVPVRSSLGYSGLIDMVVETADALYPVEMKLTSEPWRENHVMQLVAYAIALEETWHSRVTKGFLLQLPSHDARAVGMTALRRQRLVALVTAIRALVEAESLPEPTPCRGRCTNCEWRRFCADVS